VSCFTGTLIKSDRPDTRAISIGNRIASTISAEHQVVPSHRFEVSVTDDIQNLQQVDAPDEGGIEQIRALRKLPQMGVRQIGL